MSLYETRSAGGYLWDNDISSNDVMQITFLPLSSGISALYSQPVYNQSAKDDQEENAMVVLNYEQEQSDTV